MRLAQGTGLAGLTGMERISHRGNLMMARPMLGLTRQDCEQYVAEYGVSAIQDKSNADQTYTRAYIREAITPVVERRWSNVATRVSKQSHIWLEDFKAMDACVQHLLSQVTKHYYSLPYLDVDRLQHFTPSVRLVFLKSWIRASPYQVPDHAKLVTFVRQLDGASFDSHPQLLDARLLLTVDRKRVFMLPAAIYDSSEGTEAGTRHVGLSLYLFNKLFSWRISCEDNAQSKFGHLVNHAAIRNLKAVSSRSYNTQRKLLQSLQVPWFVRNLYPALMIGDDCCGVAGKIWRKDMVAFWSSVQVVLEIRDTV